MKKHLLVVATLLLLIASAHAAPVPASKHIFHIMLENTSYEHMVGNTSDMPFLNHVLIPMGALETNFYVDDHGSAYARQLVFSGKGELKSMNPFPRCNVAGSEFTADNLVRGLLKKGLTWKSYNEDLPAAGSQVIDMQYYKKGHNGLTFYEDACGSDRYWSVPFSSSTAGFYHDAANHSFANFNDIDPKLTNDCHDSPDGSMNKRSAALRACDHWLSINLPYILRQSYFQAGGDGQLWITVDEGDLYPTWDKRGGGGHILMLVIGPRVKKGYRSNTFHTLPDVLRTWYLSFKLDWPFPGAANKDGRSLYDVFF